MDEMFVNRKGSKKLPGKQGHLSTIYDEHRQAISTFLSHRRDSKAMIKTLKMAIDEARFYPAIIPTDKCKIYGYVKKIS